MGRGRKILLTPTPVLARTGLINQVNPKDYGVTRKCPLDTQMTLIMLAIQNFGDVNFTIALFSILGSGGLTAYEKQAIVDAHNRLRQSIALGQVSSQPPAANMMEMVRHTYPNETQPY